jgi:hypothetical protein
MSLAVAWLVVPLGACQELVHMGQISDRESGFAIGNARIRQQQEDRSWKLLGKTDGNGRWWIMKEDLRSGGLIGISKPGYLSLSVSESEFLQEHNLLMIPTGRMSPGDGAGLRFGDQKPDHQRLGRNGAT